MPIINIPSRNVQLNFPDTMSDEEIQSAIEKEYPRNGEDVALEIDQVKNDALEGKTSINPFDQMSNDDYVLYRKHLADKKTSFGDAIGIAKDTFGHIIDEVGTGIGATAYKLSQGEIGPVAESAGAGMVAGTIGLTDIAGKILNPAQPIPSKEDFIGKVAKPSYTSNAFMGMGGMSPNVAGQDLVNTEEDYNKLIEAEKQRDAGVVNNLYAMELTMRGAPIEEVSRGFQYVDPTLLAGAASAAVKTGASLFSKAGAKAALGAAVSDTIESGAMRPFVSTAPSGITQAGLGAIEGTAGAVQGVASLPSRALQGVGQIAESVAPGSGVGAQATALTASAMGDLGLTAGVVGGAKATEKVAEVVGAAANAAKQEASRAGLLEQVALNPNVSPTGRKLAAGLAQLQPVGRAALDLTKGAVKGAAAGSVVGGALGGLAERNLEGVAAGFGAGGALGGLTGSLHSAFDLGKEALGGSTSRTRLQATGDLNTFISTRPEIEQGAWSDTMSKLVDKVGPERAASQLDAMRVAEASGGKIRVATPDEIKQGLAPGWVNIDGMEIVLNPEKIRGDTAAHESAHVLFNSVINRAFRPEIEAAIYGIADPVTGQIVKAGVFDDIALGKVAEQIRDAYGKNTVAANEFQGFANTLKNSTDADSLANARSRIADEMTAAYTGRLFERTRAGRFNPDRLPLVYRNVLSAIEDGILDKFRSAIFEKGMDLGFDNVAKTFKDKNGKPIRIPELDAIVKKAFAQKLKTVDVANAKPDLIPVKPADRVLWAKTYGGAKGVLNDDGTPKSQAQIDAEAAARWQDMTSRLSALPDNEKTGIDFSRDKAGKTVMTAKGQLSPTAINAILDSGALDPSAKAVLVEVLNSMQRADKSTFDTRYYGVYTRGKGGNKMVAGVKSASQNEILPYSVEINSKDGVLIRAVDMSKVRDRLATAMNKPQFKNAYSNPADALKDLRKYMDNLTQINAVDSATLLGGGVKGATKRNLFYDALGFRLRNGETLFNAPDSVINKSQNTIKSYRAERFAKLVDSGNKFAFEEATTYERALRNFQPDAFTPESLPNGESFTNPDGYRILNKAGSKLFRTYDDTGKLIGIAESKEKAMKKAQDEFAKKAMKEEPANIRFQFAGEAAEMPKFMRDSLETAKAMAKEGKDSETIRAITGWFPGKYDDKMRWEVPDNEARYLPATKQWGKGSEQWAANLDEIIDHPALFEAYPEARQIRVSRLATSDTARGSFSSASNRISLNALKDNMENFSTLLHEVQHWIQDKEGFAKGSNPQMFEKPAGLPRHIINNALDIAQSANVYNMTVAKLKENPPKRLQYLPEESWYLAENNDIKKLLKEHELSNRSANPEDAYRRTAGEIESRDIQARQSFTPEQRKAIAPYSSENIAKDEAIVLKSASKSPTEMRFQADSTAVKKAKKSVEENGLFDLSENPLGINADGTVTLYHRTTKEKADSLRRSGKFKSLENTDETFFSNIINGQNEGYGDEIIAVRVDPKFVRLDDAFDNEIHVAVNNRYLSLKNIDSKPASSDIRFQPISERELSTRWDSYPKTRGELTKPKILSALKGARNPPVSRDKLAKFVMTYDNAQDLMDHTYYHGTGNFISETVKPSITMSDRQAEQMGGGGYGEKYWAISLSKSKRKSEAFAGQSRSVSVHPVLLKKSAKVIEMPGIEDSADLSDHIIDLWKNQVDAVWIGGGEQELAVINPKALVFAKDADTYQVFGGFKSEDFTLEKAQEVMNQAAEVISNPESTIKIRFQPDPTSPNILNGSNGSRIIKSNSGKYRVYLATGALAGIKDTLESAQKLVQSKSKSYAPN